MLVLALAKPTMQHVALFYGAYVAIFGSFMLLVWALRVFARRAVLNNNTDQALRLYDKLWFLFGPAVRANMRPQIQINLAIVHAAQGNKGRALLLLQDARRHARDLKTPDLLIQSSLLLTRYYREERDLDQAYRSLVEARGVSERDPKKPLLLTILRQLAEVYQAQNKENEVAQTYQALRRAAEAVKEHGTAILALTHLGRIAYEDCQWNAAEEYFTEAVQRVRTTGCKDRSAVLAYVLHGRLCLQRGRWELARGYLQEAAQSAKARGEAGLECVALLELGRLFVEQGRYRNAEEMLKASEEIATKLGEAARLAMVHQVYGDCYLQTDGTAAALYHFKAAEKYLNAKPLIRTEILVQTGLALIAAHEGASEDAWNALIEAERMALKHRASFELVCVYDAMSLVQAKSGDGDEAAKYHAMAHEQRAELGIQAAMSTQFRRTTAA